MPVCLELSAYSRVSVASHRVRGGGHPSDATTVMTAGTGAAGGAPYV